MVGIGSHVYVYMCYFRSLTYWPRKCVTWCTSRGDSFHFPPSLKLIRPSVA